MKKILFILLIFLCFSCKERCEVNLNRIKVKNMMYSLHFKERLAHDFDSALDSLKSREQISTEYSVKQLDVDFCVDNRCFYQIGYSAEFNEDSVYYRDYDVLDTKGNYYWMYLDECGNR